MKLWGDFLAIGAVICEYNPFHKGHFYQLEQMKKEGAEYIVAVMSGNFVQRCESAIFSKQARTLMALNSGVDLVIELPLPWATASAEKFAEGGVGLVNALGVVDFLSFGSECGDTNKLENTARLILELDGGEELKKRLAQGVSFPKARQEALVELINNYNIESYPNNDTKFYEDALLRAPNDILAIEYIKALVKSDSAVRPAAVKRIGAKHDSIGESGGFLSASELRYRIKTLFPHSSSSNMENYPSDLFKNGMIKDGVYSKILMELNESIGEFVPLQTMEIMAREISKNTAPADFIRLETAILSDLRKRPPSYFLQLANSGEGLENRIFCAAQKARNLDELYMGIRAKRYTLSRARRLVLCAYLEIFSEYTSVPPPYIRILGMNNKGKNLLKKAKHKASLPIVTRVGDFKKLGENARRIFELEARSTAIYNLCLPHVGYANTEYTDGLLVNQVSTELRAYE